MEFAFTLLTVRYVIVHYKRLVIVHASCLMCWRYSAYYFVDRKRLAACGSCGALDYYLGPRLVQ